MTLKLVPGATAIVLAICGLTGCASEESSPRPEHGLTLKGEGRNKDAVPLAVRLPDLCATAGRPFEIEVTTARREPIVLVVLPVPDEESDFGDEILKDLTREVSSRKNRSGMYTWRPVIPVGMEGPALISVSAGSLERASLAQGEINVSRSCP